MLRQSAPSPGALLKTCSPSSTCRDAAHPISATGMGCGGGGKSGTGQHRQQDMRSTPP